MAQEVSQLPVDNTDVEASDQILTIDSNDSVRLRPMARLFNYINSQITNLQRAFGPAAGQIATQAEGNNGDEWPVSKIPNIGTNKINNFATEVRAEIATNTVTLTGNQTVQDTKNFTGNLQANGANVLTTATDVIATAVDDTRNLTSPNLQFWSGTQAQYDALATYDDDTLYQIEGTTIPVAITNNAVNVSTGTTASANITNGQLSLVLPVAGSNTNTVTFNDNTAGAVRTWAEGGAGAPVIPADRVATLNQDTTGSAGSATVASSVDDIANTPNLTFWSGSQADYDALSTYDANTLYQVDGSITTIFSGSFNDLSNRPTTLAGYGITDSPDVSNFITASSTDTLTNKSIAATQLTGTIDDARIPAGIARDTEIPDVTNFITASSTDTLTNKSISASQVNSGILDSARIPTLNQNTTGTAALATTVDDANSPNNLTLWTGTETQYTAIGAGNYDDNTLYYVE